MAGTVISGLIALLFVFGMVLSSLCRCKGNLRFSIPLAGQHRRAERAGELRLRRDADRTR